MDWSLLLTGLAIGVAVAAPIGPINLMCIQRSLTHGFAAGLAVGIGAVMGDGTFAMISAFGLTWVSNLVAGHTDWISGIGGSFLLAIGVRTMLIQPVGRAPGLANPNSTASAAGIAWVPLGRMIGTTFLLTITNPATMLGFLAIFSGVGGLVVVPGSYGSATVLVGAVMGGSLLWWVAVSRVVSLVRARFSSAGLLIINRVAGAVIALFGLAALVGVFL